MGASLLYTWKGTDATLPPVLLTSHLDVVPADVPADLEPPVSEMLQEYSRMSLDPSKDHGVSRVDSRGSLMNESESWQHPPFSGDIADGFIWGRGTLDDKVGVVGILEAVEGLVRAGYEPRRTVYLAFGQDEEVGGELGAQKIARQLASREIRLFFVLDEGTPVVRGIVPGVEAPVALIGVAEKGYVTLVMDVKAQGGHSSSPPEHTAIGLLAQAISRLEANPFPARLDGVAERFFVEVGPEMAFSRKLLFANLWLFRPLIVKALASSPATSPLVRTTTAITQIDGGTQENVLPREARAIVNFRLLPGDTVEGLRERVREVVDDDRISIRFLNKSQALGPSDVSVVDAPPFRVVESHGA